MFCVVEPRDDEDDERPGRDNGVRRPPMSCEELACGPTDLEKCQEFTFDDGRPQRAFCIPDGECIYNTVTNLLSLFTMVIRNLAII